jgi:hypothetical protein
VQDVGRLLLQQIGFDNPSDSAVQQAIAANEHFIEQLQAIRDRELGSATEH